MVSFNTNPPTNTSNGFTLPNGINEDGNQIELSLICDKNNGLLLFGGSGNLVDINQINYDTSRVLDRNLNYLPKTSGINFKVAGIDQNCLFLPLPGDTNKFVYLFNTPENYNIYEDHYRSGTRNNDWEYCTIDKTLNNGFGGYVPNSMYQFGKNLSSIIAATKLCNGDFWILAHGFQNDTFYAYKFNNNGRIKCRH